MEADESVWTPADTVCVAAALGVEERVEWTRDFTGDRTGLEGVVATVAVVEEGVAMVVVVEEGVAMVGVVEEPVVIVTVVVEPVAMAAVVEEGVAMAAVVEEGVAMVAVSLSAACVIFGLVAK